MTPVRASGKWFSTTHEKIHDSRSQRTAAGQQTLIEINGLNAPQRYKFDVDLPFGSRLMPAGRGIAAVDSYGSVVGTLEAPWAVDAVGLRIPTRFEIVDRDTFVQVVSHRAAATYPVYADPWWVVPILVREGARQLGRWAVRRATYEAAKRAALKMAAKQAAMNIDDLIAKTPIKLLTLTASNFRKNVMRKTGWSKAAATGYDAHHTLPQKFKDDFSDAGINIHHPIYGHWWCHKAHLKYARAYNKAWENWLDDKDIEDTAAWRNQIEKKRLALTSKSEWSATHQCP